MFVSVIIPCYNVVQYIEEGIRSVLNQTYRDIDVLCLDDCSTDGTYEVLLSLSQGDNRLKVYRNHENLGLIGTLNKLVSLSENDLLIRMDPDDVSIPDRIERLLERQVVGDFDIVSSDYKYIDEKGEIVKQKKLDLLTSEAGICFTACFNSPIPHAPCLIKRKILEGNKYDYNYTAAEDYNLWTRLLLQENVKVSILNESLYLYRVNISSMSNTHNITQANNHIKIAKSYTRALTGLNVDNMNVWNMAKKQYSIEQLTPNKVYKILDEVLLIKRSFIKNYPKLLSAEEKNDIDLYTSQYLLYLYYSVFKEMQKRSVLIGVSIVMKHLFYNLSFFIKNTKSLLWLMKKL